MNNVTPPPPPPPRHKKQHRLLTTGGEKEVEEEALCCSPDSAVDRLSLGSFRKEVRYEVNLMSSCQVWRNWEERF